MSPNCVHGNDVGSWTKEHLINSSCACSQIEALERNPHIIVGTPGRTIELVKEGHLSLGEMIDGY